MQSYFAACPRADIGTYLAVGVYQDDDLANETAPTNSVHVHKLMKNILVRSHA